MIYMEPELFVRVASFDVGLKNMSMCVVDFHNHEFVIRKWANITFENKANIYYCIHNLLK